MTDKCICAPIGAYMNHVRWLALADKRIYNIVSRVVYPPARNAFNWLEYEWEHREKQMICNIIQCEHYLNYALQQPDLTKLVFLHQSTESCFKHYLKFNPGLNLQTVEEFKTEIDNCYADMNSFESDHINVLHLSVENFSNPELDEDWYNSLVEFFGFSGEYQFAKQIHELWYLANKRAENDMMTLPKNVDDYPWQFISTPKNLNTQEEYDNLLRLIESTYQ